MRRRGSPLDALRAWRDSAGLNGVFSLAADRLIAGAPEPDWLEAADRDIRRAWRRAVAPLAQQGWEAQARAVAQWGPNGNLGVIRLVGSMGAHPLGANPLVFELSAGVASQVLATTIERVDLAGARLASVRTHLALDGRPFGFTIDPALADPRVRSAASPTGGRPPLLTPETAPAWLGAALGELAAAVEALLDDASLCRALVARSRFLGGDYMLAREAALLAERLGWRDELPGILDAAESAWRKEQRRWRGPRWEPGDDRLGPKKMHMWSHERFVRYLETRPGPPGG